MRSLLTKQDDQFDTSTININFVPSETLIHFTVDVTISEQGIKLNKEK